MDLGCLIAALGVLEVAAVAGAFAAAAAAAAAADSVSAAGYSWAENYFVFEQRWHHPRPTTVWQMQRWVSARRSLHRYAYWREAMRREMKRMDPRHPCCRHRQN